MADHIPIPLTPTAIRLDSDEFAAILRWPYADKFVARILANDIPQRVQFGYCRIWVYRDPDSNLVGFGTLDLCLDYGAYTENQLHPYIPLLATNPTMVGRGYGTGIVRHLIEESVLLAMPANCYKALFLDVYTTSEQAIKLYRKCQFQEISPSPIPDEQNGGVTYIVMALGLDVGSHDR